MCLAIPGLVTSKHATDTRSIPATVRFGSAVREVDLVLVPDVEVGDYVIVHAGFAIRILPTEDAADLLKLVAPQE